MYNLADLPLVNAAERANLAIYPSSAVRAKLFFVADVSPQVMQLYDQAWEQILDQYKQGN